MIRSFSLSSCLLLLMSGVPYAAAQNIVASTNPARKGSGDLSVSFQSYYDSANGVPAANVQGAAVSLRQFYPRTGLLSLQLEPVTNRGRFALGENYLQWSGLPFASRHWDLAAGDFHSSMSVVENPFPNLPTPEVSLRGARVIARTDHVSYSVYGGAETLSQGSRVPYRTRVPQRAIGAEVAASISKRVQLGFRYLHLASSLDRVKNQPLFFPANRQFTRSDSFASQAGIHMTDQLQWYAEAGWSQAAEMSGTASSRPQFSLVSGPAWHSDHLILRANYFSQGAAYLPVLGYYLGDRRGFNADGTWTVGRLGLFGNAGQARNNREHNPDMPDYFSRQGGGGVQFRLPANVYLSGSMSQLHFETVSKEAGLVSNDTRQVQVMISRPIYRHNLHATWQRLDSEIQGKGQRLQFLEVEDNYAWRRLSAGAATRWQRQSADQVRQSLFLRASGQYQTHKLSVYAYWEKGKDLANETLLSTQVSSTSVVGVSWLAPQSLTFKLEAFRNHLNTVLNPESLFVLGNRGILPDSVLNRTDDWSLFLRVSREFSWGEPGTLGGGLRQPEAPLTGTVAGYVRFQTLQGESGAGEVWVLMDTGQAIKTDSTGYFQMMDVPQGTRILKLDLDRLPADYNPPERREISIEVRSGQVSRASLRVTALTSIEGTVSDESGEPADEGIVLRLAPGDAYTRTDADGRFGFYNLPEGDYEITVVESSLPENAHLIPPLTIAVSPQHGESTEPVAFRYQIVQPGSKPTRKVFNQDQKAPMKSPSRAVRSRDGKRRIIIQSTVQSIASASTTSASGASRKGARWEAR
jgi:hypothetical protein